MRSDEPGRRPRRTFGNIGNNEVPRAPTAILETAMAFGSFASTPSPAATVAPSTSSPVSTPSPTPIGFVLPPGCAYVGPRITGPEPSQNRQVDCGSDANRNARGTLGPVFTQQGWTSCGAGLATATWTKGETTLTVSESSGAPATTLVQEDRLSVRVPTKWYDSSPSGEDSYQCALVVLSMTSSGARRT